MCGASSGTLSMSFSIAPTLVVEESEAWSTSDSMRLGHKIQYTLRHSSRNNGESEPRLWYSNRNAHIKDIVPLQ